MTLPDIQPPLFHLRLASTLRYPPDFPSPEKFNVMKEPLSVQSNKNRKINIVWGEGEGCFQDAPKSNFNDKCLHTSVAHSSYSEIVGMDHKPTCDYDRIRTGESCFKKPGVFY